MSTQIMELFVKVLVTLSFTGVSPEDREIAQAVANAYRANRMAATFGRIEFNYETGRVANDQDCRDGNWIKSYVANGIHVFDEALLRHEIIYRKNDVLDAQVKIGENQWSAGPVFPARSITDGFVTLFDKHDLIKDPPIDRHNLTIIPGDEHATANAAVIPLTLGAVRLPLDSLPEMLESSLRSDSQVRLVKVDTKAEVEGLRAVMFELRTERGLRRTWVDLNRGAIPVLTIDVVDDLPDHAITVRMEDIRQVDGRIWLPFRKSNVVPGLGKVLTIIRADFSRRPKSADFRLSFDEAVPVTDAVRQKRYPARKTWDLASLPGGRYTEAVPSLPPPPPPPPLAEKDPTNWLRWAMAGVAAILVGAGAWRIWRSRR